MSGLPLGWDIDYDGKRWFYTYKATGHVQYKFPTEGDEFPDYIDAASPAPQLAPEERLESQQQMRRQTNVFFPDTYEGQGSSSGGGARDRGGTGWKSRMSATARPVSHVWDGDFGVDDDEDTGAGPSGAFQPESFMFLGPGAYTDVSPLVEEEDEAAKRAIAGRVHPGPGEHKVSPDGSERTTPLVNMSNVSPAPAPPPVPVPEPMPVAKPSATPVPSAAPVSPEREPPAEVFMLDSREMPHELPVEEPYNPVGVVVEMATEHTATARIETHPDPVEIGDSSMLAPIETAAPEGYAELPGRQSPVEARQKEVLAGEPRLEDMLYGRVPVIGPPQAVEAKPREADVVAEPVQTQPQPQTEDPASSQFKITRKPTNPGKGKYQAYAPGQTQIVEPPRTSDDGWTSNSKRTSLQRDPSLIGARTKDEVAIDPQNVPSVLAPPQRPTQSGADVPRERPQSTLGVPPIQAVQAIPAAAPSIPQDAASVPALFQPPGSVRQQPPQQQPLQDIPPGQQPPGLTKFPSILKPAHGRTPSQTGQLGAPPQAPAPDTARPRRSYEEPDTGEQSPSSSQYTAYTGPHPASHPVSQVPMRPASAMPFQGSSTQNSMSTQDVRPAQRQPPWAHITTDELRRPASTPAVPPPGRPSQPGQKSWTPGGGPAQQLPQNNAIRRISGATEPFPVSPPDSSSTGRRHSDFTPTDVSPIDQVTRRRESSTGSSASLFTPSPVSQTAGSHRGSVASTPGPRPSGLRHSISGPSVGQPRPGSSRPPAEESYFPEQRQGNLPLGHPGGAQQVSITPAPLQIRAPVQPNQVQGQVPAQGSTMVYAPGQPPVQPPVQGQALSLNDSAAYTQAPPVQPMPTQQEQAAASPRRMSMPVGPELAAIQQEQQTQIPVQDIPIQSVEGNDGDDPTQRGDKTSQQQMPPRHTSGSPGPGQVLAMIEEGDEPVPVPRTASLLPVNNRHSMSSTVPLSLPTRAKLVTISPRQSMAAPQPGETQGQTGAPVPLVNHQAQPVPAVATGVPVEAQPPPPLQSAAVQKPSRPQSMPGIPPAEAQKLNLAIGQNAGQAGQTRVAGPAPPGAPGPAPGPAPAPAGVYPPAPTQGRNPGPSQGAATPGPGPGPMAPPRGPNQFPNIPPGAMPQRVQTLPQGMYQQAGPFSPVQGGPGQPSWNIQVAPGMANPGFAPGMAPSSPATPSSRENKWTKWFRGGSKHSKQNPLAQSPVNQQQQPMYYVPAAPGQMLPPGMQFQPGQPPPGWAGWQPGQQMVGPPGAPMQWQPMPSGAVAPSPQGSFVSLQSTSGRHSMDSPVLQKQQPPVGMGQMPMMGQQPPPPGAIPRPVTMADLPSQQAARPVSGQYTQSQVGAMAAGNKTGVPSSASTMASPAAAKSNKWARQPAADYSGGDWGDEDAWNAR